MRPEDFDIQKIIDGVQGTCETLQSIIDSHYPEMSEDDLNSEDHETLNDQVFLCEQCGWWCETSDRGEDEDECFGDICTDCIEDQ